MDQCARCGHTLGAGRYCVNCGQPRGESVDDWRTGTAERPAVPAEPGDPGAPAPEQAPWGPTAPPPVYETPRSPRFPLYADDADTTDSASEPEPEPSLLWDIPVDDDDRRRSALPWLIVAAAVVLVLVAVAGVFLLVGGGGDEQADDPGPATGTSATDSGSPTEPQPTTDPPTSEPASPTTQPTTEPPGEPEDVAGAASASAPVTAPPSTDVDGNAVRYEAFNMVDGADDTAWRAPGDAAGTTLTFALAEPTRLSSVGLLNGYAKRDPGYDGYTANRRVLAVEWVFDDGTVVPQTLGESRSVQSIDVDVTTSSVQLRLVDVGDPGRGPSGRDFTAISTVALLGVPAQR